MTTIIRTATWLIGLLAALIALLAVGEVLPPPPLPTDLSATWSWLDHTDPALAVFSVLRIAAIVVVAYLLASTTILVAAGLSRTPALIRAATAVTVPAARRAIGHMAGAGLVLALAGTTLPGPTSASALGPVSAPDSTWAWGQTAGDGAVAAEEPRHDGGDEPRASATPVPVLRALPDEPILVHLGDAPPSSVPRSTEERPVTTADPLAPPDFSTDSPTDTAGSRPSAPASAPGTTNPPDDRRGPTGPPDTEPHRQATTPDHSDERSPPPATRPAPGPMTSLPRPSDAAGATRPGGGADAGLDERASADAGAAETDRRRDDPAVPRHTIEAGDHLWGVAEATLTSAWSRPVDPDEIARYLQRLIDANRAVLAVPDHPDLVFPGQVFVLPPLPAS